jgi:hypothetical protein
MRYRQRAMILFLREVKYCELETVRNMTGA